MGWETLRTMRDLRPDIVSFCITVLLFTGCSERTRITTQSDKALGYYTTGVLQWEKFYYPEAAFAFDEAIRYDSNFAMAWARRALLDDALLNHAKAISDISRAMSLSNRVTAFERMFIQLQDCRLMYANNQAERLADSLLHLYPDEKEIWLIRGNLYEVGKNFEEAIRSYQRAVRIDTSYALAVMSLGYAFSTTGDQDRAVAQMERYIRLAPDAADPRASFADILLRVGRYEEALEQYRQSLALKPDYWYSANQIGGIYMLKGMLRAAEDQFHKGMASLPPSDALRATHLALDGNLNVLRGLCKEAVQQYRRALELDSSNSEAAYGLVIALKKMKDFPLAHERLEAIREDLTRKNLLQSQYMLRYFLTSSRVFLDEGKPDAARSVCDSALDYSTTLSRAPVFRQIAEIDLYERRYEDALDACEEALRMNPNHPDPLFTLAKVYHAKGDSLMTKEISDRLLDFWKNADPDFQGLQELRQVLKTTHPASAPPISSL